MESPFRALSRGADVRAARGAQILRGPDWAAAEFPRRLRHRQPGSGLPGSARRLSAAFGTATVPAIYFAAAPMFGPAAGLAGAAITAVSTLPVRESKYATTDAATVFWLTLALAMALRIARRGRTVDYLLAGLFLRLATAAKYPAGAVVFAVAAAHLGVWRRERRRWRWQLIADPGIYLAAGTAAVTFFCATPYLFLDWAQTVNDIRPAGLSTLRGG